MKQPEESIATLRFAWAIGDFFAKNGIQIQEQAADQESPHTPPLPFPEMTTPELFAAIAEERARQQQEAYYARNRERYSSIPKHPARLGKKMA